MVFLISGLDIARGCSVDSYAVEEVHNPKSWKADGIVVSENSDTDTEKVLSGNCQSEQEEEDNSRFCQKGMRVSGYTPLLANMLRKADAKAFKAKTKRMLQSKDFEDDWEQLSAPVEKFSEEAMKKHKWTEQFWLFFCKLSTKG